MNLQEAKSLFAGAMISVATPATPDFELDLDAYRRNLRFMIERGAATGNAVFLVAAAGGEFPMLNVEQRKTLMRVAVETVEGKVAIAASIQSNSTRTAIELASYAKSVGVALGQLSSPYYYEPTYNDIIHYFADVAAGSGLPIMVYNNWWNTANMNVATVEKLAEIDEVVALKWSAPSHGPYIDGYERLAGRLAIVDNTGQHVNASLMGATGFVTHISNFWPEYPRRLWRLMQEGAHTELMHDALKFKRAWRHWLTKVIEYTEGEGPFIKAALDEVGLPSGAPFPPSQPVPDDLRQELRQLLAEYQVPEA